MHLTRRSKTNVVVVKEEHGLDYPTVGEDRLRGSILPFVETALASDVRAVPIGRGLQLSDASQ